jgi:hypothetical protein
MNATQSHHISSICGSEKKRCLKNWNTLQKGEVSTLFSRVMCRCKSPWRTNHNHRIAGNKSDDMPELNSLASATSRLVLFYSITSRADLKKEIYTFQRSAVTASVTRSSVCALFSLHIKQTHLRSPKTNTTVTFYSLKTMRKKNGTTFNLWYRVYIYVFLTLSTLLQ